MLILKGLRENLAAKTLQNTVKRGNGCGILASVDSTGFMAELGGLRPVSRRLGRRHSRGRSRPPDAPMAAGTTQNLRCFLCVILADPRGRRGALSYRDIIPQRDNRPGLTLAGEARMLGLPSAFAAEVFV